MALYSQDTQSWLPAARAAPSHLEGDGTQPGSTPVPHHTTRAHHIVPLLTPDPSAARGARRRRGFKGAGHTMEAE